MIADEPQAEPALTWWGRLTDAEREAWKDRAGRTFQAGTMTMPRRKADMARDADALQERGEVGRRFDTKAGHTGKQLRMCAGRRIT